MPNLTEGVEMGQAARVWSLRDADIGGAWVRRGFTRFTKDGATYLKAGAMLSAEEVRSIPMVNRRALSVSGALDIYPVAPDGPAAAPTTGERYIIRGSGGHYDVIEGRKLNDEPLSKADAEALAAA